MNLKKETARITDVLKGVVITIVFLVGHLYFSPMLYVAAALTLALYVIDYKNVVGLTVFFIPLARIMKFSPDSMTVLGIAVILSLCVMLIYNKLRFGGAELLIGAVLVLLLLVKNLIGAFGFPFSYIRIILLLVLLPQCIDYYKSGRDNFNLPATAVMAFAGVCTAALIAAIWADSPQLARYIATEDIYYVGVTIFNRFCGLSSDPNYFSSLVLFAAALQLICFINTKRSVYMLCAVLLSAIGALTLSKMFFLLIAFVWCVSIIMVLLDKRTIERKRSQKGKVLFISSLGLVAFAVYFVQSGNFDVVASRFGGTGASSITTGRSDIWMAYLSSFFSSIKTMLLGAATNAETVGFHVTHNTLIQILWKLGSIGAAAIFAWCIALYVRVKNRTASTRSKANKGTAILLFAYLLPMMALDKLFFDEFYWYYAVYLLCHIRPSDTTVLCEGK